MLHILWLIFIVSAFLASLYQVFILGHLGAFSDVMDAMWQWLVSVEIAIGLVGGFVGVLAGYISGRRAFRFN